MSSSKTNAFIHPFNFTVVDNVDQALENLRNGRVSQAVEGLFWFSAALDPEIKLRLKDDIELLNQMSTRQRPMNRLKVFDILNKILGELHAAGYFLQAKYNPLTSKDFKGMSGEPSEAEENNEGEE